MSTSPMSSSLNPDDRFYNIDFVIDQIGYRPLARRANLSAGHVHRVLNGKIKSPVLGTLRKLSAASQISLDDLIFYVEKQMDLSRKNARTANAA